MTVLTRRSFALGAAALATLPPVGRARAQEGQFFRIASGPTESGFFAVATLIASAVSSPPGSRDCERGGSCGVPGLIAVNQTTAGSLANVAALAARQAESALCQADIAYWAFHGTGLFRRQGAARNLRAIANLFPEHVHVVVRRAAQIRELRQLRGKAVSLGERDGGTPVTARAVLQAAGLQERDVKAQFLKPGQAVEALREGKLDAMFEVAALPSVPVADAAKGSEIDLLAISGPIATRLRAAFPFFNEAAIPAATYGASAETATVAVGALWVVDAEVDEAVVHGLTRALWHPNNRRALDQGHPVGRSIRIETALDGVALQLHPGAALYYFEAGLIR